MYIYIYIFYIYIYIYIYTYNVYTSIAERIAKSNAILFINQYSSQYCNTFL